MTLDNIPRLVMLLVYASFPIDPARYEEARDLVASLVGPSREEAGMQNYYATIDVRDDHVIRVFEQYEDQTALTAHAESDHAQAFLESLPDLLAGEPEVLQFEVSNVTELEF